MARHKKEKKCDRLWQQHVDFEKSIGPTAMTSRAENILGTPLGGGRVDSVTFFTNPGGKGVPHAMGYLPRAGTPPHQGGGGRLWTPVPADQAILFYFIENGQFRIPCAFGAGGVLLQHNPPQNPTPGVENALPPPRLPIAHPSPLGGRTSSKRSPVATHQNTAQVKISSKGADGNF